MLSSKIATSILNCLVNQGSNANIKIGMQNAKLALFTQMPNADGTGEVEVTLDGYSKKNLGGVGISGISQFSTAAVWSEVDQMYTIANTDEIQMHAISEAETREETVQGFGIYATHYDEESKKSETILYAWGNLVDDQGDNTTVTLKAGSVPIFYVGKFKLMMG